MPLPDTVVTERQKKEKRKPEPSPYKEYHRKNENTVPFLRIGYFDGWEQMWVIEGRVRTPTGGVSKSWKPVGYMSDKTEWFHNKMMSQFFVDMVPTFRREIRECEKRVKEWCDKGGMARDLYLKMARENGTLPKADLSLSREEVKYD